VSRTRVLLGAVAFALCAAVAAQPPSNDVVIVPPGPSIPPIQWDAVKGEARVSSDITLGFSAKSRCWLVDDNGATLRMASDGKSGTLRSETARAVRILVLPEGVEPQFRVVNVGGYVPPGPGPKPPDPMPNSPLRERLKAAFDADLAPLATRQANAAKLAALFRKAAEFAERRVEGDALDRPYFFTTTGQLRDAVASAASGMVGPNDLIALRRQISVEIAGTEAAPGPLGFEGPLDDATRVRAAGLFREIAANLDSF